MKINFKDIIIPDMFAKSTPARSKMDKCRIAYDAGVLDRDLVVNCANVLTDGYVLYCVMQEHNYEGEVEVKMSGKRDGIATTYVYGKHPGDDKERVWYINMSYNKVKDKVGRRASVQTVDGIQPITITRVERSMKQPYSGIIRKVVYL